MTSWTSNAAWGREACWEDVTCVLQAILCGQITDNRHVPVSKGLIFEKVNQGGTVMWKQNSAFFQTTVITLPLNYLESNAYRICHTSHMSNRFSFDCFPLEYVTAAFRSVTPSL